MRVTPPVRIAGWMRGGLSLLPGLDDEDEDENDSDACEAAERGGGGVITGLIADAQRAHGGRRRHAELARVQALLDEGVAYLQRGCDRGALATARRFARSRALRWFVYAAIADDARGRVAQLAEVCPGVLILCYALSTKGRQREVAAVLDAVRRGEKLGRVLARTCELWEAIWAVRWPELPRAARAQQRGRIRAAGPAVEPMALHAPGLPGVVAAEAPREARENARWFEVTQLSLCALPAGASTLPETTLRGLGGFISLHWRALERLHRFDVRRVLRQVVDYVWAAERCPNRRTDPYRLLDEVAAWHETGNWYAEAGLPPRLALPHDGIEQETRVGSDVLAPLTTVRALIEESDRMHHCVASYARRAAAGDVQVFHAEVGGRAITVMTERAGDRLFVREAQGVSNRALTPEEREAIEALLAARTSQPSEHRV